jgi:hypothetical protein
MTGFYDILDKLKWHFDNDEIVNSVTQGDIFQVDLNKQTIFPLTHIMVNSSSLQSNTQTFNVSILAMDIVDISKSEVTDVFQENNNELDVLNTQHHVLNRCYQQMLHGNLWDLDFVVAGDPTLEPFTERFENLLAGWTMTFDVTIPNDMTICDTGSYAPYCSPSYVVNTDNSYHESVASGETLTLPDTTLNLQIDGTQVATSTFATLSNQLINLVWQ